jgi:hypothetical protein
VYRRPGKKRKELGAILYEPAALDCLCLTLQDGITSKSLCADLYLEDLARLHDNGRPGFRWALRFEI